MASYILTLPLYRNGQYVLFTEELNPLVRPDISNPEKKRFTVEWLTYTNVCITVLYVKPRFSFYSTSKYDEEYFQTENICCFKLRSKS